MDLPAVVGGAYPALLLVPAQESGSSFQINLFWVIVSSLNFILFLSLLYVFALRPISQLLADRRQRIEQGLKDAEQARQDRERAEAERIAALAEARKEAKDILDRAQKVAQESREADMAATRSELERLRDRAAADIEAEKQRAMADLRQEVANLALEAAGRVVGESMTGERQRRLVDEFIRESAETRSRSRS